MWTLISVFGLVFCSATLVVACTPNVGVHNASFIFGLVAFTAFALYMAARETERENVRKREEEVRLLGSFGLRENQVPNRSQWEEDIASYVRDAYPSYRIVTNDRTVITASDGRTPLEIDIYIPELKLGIEADGIRWHDRDAYNRDRRNGTEHSEEMYKERYCARKGIKLIHIWDADGMDANKRAIDNAIREQQRK